MATWDDVASIVGELQLTGEPSPHEWRVGKKLIAWERPLRESDREALAARGIERGGRFTWKAAAASLRDNLADLI